MELPKVVKISAPPLRRLKNNSDKEGSNIAKTNLPPLSSEDKQLPPSPIPAPVSPIDSLNGLFQKTWQEIESACEFETIPTLDFALDAPLIEGELLVLESNKELAKRWCVVQNNVFTIYKSFKHRIALIDINLNGDVKVIPAEEPHANGLHGFRLFAGARYLECYSTSAVTAQAWSVNLSPNSSPRASSTHLSHYSSLSFSPQSPKPHTLPMILNTAAPGKALTPDENTDPMIENTGLSLIIPEKALPAIVHSAPVKSSSAANNIFAQVDSNGLNGSDKSLPLIMHSAPIKSSSTANNIFAQMDSKAVVPDKALPTIAQPDKNPVVDINGLAVVVPARNQSLHSPKLSYRQLS